MLEQEVRGEVQIRFYRAQHEVQVMDRCRRLGVGLVRAFCANGFTHTWVLIVTTDPREAARKHACLTHVVANASVPRRRKN